MAAGVVGLVKFHGQEVLACDQEGGVQTSGIEFRSLGSIHEARRPGQVVNDAIRHVAPENLSSVQVNNASVIAHQPKN